MLSVLALAVIGCSKPAPAKTNMDKPQDKVSYIIGLNIGKGMKQDQIEVNADALANGVRDAFADKPQLSEEEMKTVMTAFQQEMMTKSQAKAQAAGAENAKAGAEFLAANKIKEGVKTTASGLQYKVISSGKGKSPKSTDTVSTNYRGTLINGTEFDSSYKRGQPATFPVTGVIPGWTEALQLMKEGDKWEIYVPAELAYGERGAGQAIGANSTLVFEIELLSIKK
jgi:FKBP-type peptidyl-prolyl cis-trans isomerase FklB